MPLPQRFVLDAAQGVFLVNFEGLVVRSKNYLPLESRNRLFAPRIGAEHHHTGGHGWDDANDRSRKGQ